MADILKGLVLNVIDSDTIEIMVTQLISGNKYDYRDREKYVLPISPIKPCSH